MKKLLIASIILNIILLTIVGYYAYKKISYDRWLAKRVKANKVKSAKENKPAFLNSKIYDYWKKRKEEFAAEKIDTSDIVFFGDSQISNCDWTNLFSKRIINRGIPGETIQSALFRITDVSKQKSKAIFIELGTNDLNMNVSESEFAASYQQLVDTIKTTSPKTSIFLFEMLPRNDSKGIMIPVYNKLIKQVAEKNHCSFIPLFDDFSDNFRNLKSDYATDAIHVNENGCGLWADKIRHHLN